MTDRNAAGEADFSAVLAFWFGWPDAPDYGRSRRAWFAKDADFDAAIRARFLETWHQAVAGGLAGWTGAARSALALVIVLDQFSRNLFRDDARAFSGDAIALATAESMVASGQDRELLPLERAFVYLPFEHAEDLVLQKRSLQLFSDIADQPECASLFDYAQRHYDIIARFGRFPHRNRALGRSDTADEQDYLAQPGAGF